MSWSRTTLSDIFWAIAILFLMALYVCVFVPVAMVCEWFGARWPDKFARFMNGDPPDC